MSLLRAPRLSPWLGLLAAGGCAGTPPPRSAPPPPAPAADLSNVNVGRRVEKVREELQLAPWDLAFSAVRGAAGQAVETVTARNLTDDPVLVRALPVLGENAALFELRDPPRLPTTVPARGQLSVGVTFVPRAGAPLGVHRALLRFQTGTALEDGPGTDLSGLAILGRVGDGEPTLAQVIETLGYAVNLGRSPTTGVASGPARGDEIPVPLFTRATPTPVALNPVARFSADGPRPFGSYEIKKTVVALDTLATLAAGQNQTLNPELETDSKASFDPGDAVFGLWVRADKRRVIYSEDQRNKGPEKHAVRVFTLHARGGAPVANAYLVAFRDGADDAFQDYVFVLWNVKPADATAGADVTARAARSR
jgi:hypothetical protein